MLLHVREQLFRLLRDISVLSVDAWRLLALSSVRHALFVGDVVKVRPQRLVGVGGFGRRMGAGWRGEVDGEASGGVGRCAMLPRPCRPRMGRS